MGLKVFSIYDSKAAVYGRPFFLQSAGVAMRIFGDMANDEKEPVGQHPEDYTLFELASWDEDSGQFTQDAANRSLANGIELKAAEEALAPVVPEKVNGGDPRNTADEIPPADTDVRRNEGRN